MTDEERVRAMYNIQFQLPDIIYNRLTEILDSIKTDAHDSIINALDKMVTNRCAGFIYHMQTGQTEKDTTPITELIDLLDGWILTSHLSIIKNHTCWNVNVIKHEKAS